MIVKDAQEEAEAGENKEQEALRRVSVWESTSFLKMNRHTRRGSQEVLYFPRLLFRAQRSRFSWYAVGSIHTPQMPCNFPPAEKYLIKK
jgi:hypothetical protein